MEKPMITSLNELRNSAEGANSKINFKKRAFGGFNTREVTAYIKMLKESLQNAERSFNSRLEEYSAISAMHKQELDKYMKTLNDTETQMFQLQQKVKLLSEENKGLQLKIEELSDNSLNEHELQMYQDMLVQNEEMKNKLQEYEELKFDNIELQTMNEQLQSVVLDLNKKIENKANNDSIKDEYEVAISENIYLKQHYDEAMSENSVLMAEKNVLTDQNKRISENLEQANEKNKELRNMITKIKFKVRKNMAESQARVYEGSQKHQINIEQITESIKNALNILQYESVDITKLLNSTNEEVDLEIDDTNNEEDKVEIVSQL